MLNSCTFDVLKPSDQRWDELFHRLPVEQQDVFYTPAYAEIAGRYLHKQGQPWCAVLERENHFILYPFLQRKLQTLLTDTGLQISGNDIHGLYGRNGLVGHKDDPDLLARFYDFFNSYCKENGILCGFDRFHPVLENHRCAFPDTRLIKIGGFIVVDLQKPLERLEREYKHSIRKNIKKALRAGVQVFSESSLDHLDSFLSIYTHTMERHDAHAFYYVDAAFYQALAKQMASNFRFFYATVEGQPVSCELVLIQGHYCHSFLGGTLSQFLDACPNHLLKHEIIRYVQAHGCRYYLLGGGETAYNSIWSYKRCFAPEGDHPSFVGGTLFNPDAYSALRREMSQRAVPFSDERFQFYDRDQTPKGVE